MVFGSKPQNIGSNFGSNLAVIEPVDGELLIGAFLGFRDLLRCSVMRDLAYSSSISLRRSPDSQVPVARVLWSPNLFWSSSNS
jgi:hypothetical protein